VANPWGMAVANPLTLTNAFVEVETKVPNEHILTFVFENYEQIMFYNFFKQFITHGIDDKSFTGNYGPDKRYDNHDMQILERIYGVNNVYEELQLDSIVKNIMDVPQNPVIFSNYKHNKEDGKHIRKKENGKHIREKKDRLAEKKNERINPKELRKKHSEKKYMKFQERRMKERRTDGSTDSSGGGSKKTKKKKIKKKKRKTNKRKIKKKSISKNKTRNKKKKGKKYSIKHK